MSRINTVDHVLALVRKQLAQTSAAAKPRAISESQRALGPMDRARLLATLGALSATERRRIIVRGVLADRFGEAIAADPAFQRIVDDVSRILESDPETSALIDTVTAQFSSA